ncbi:unnamed protein product [Rhizoctonia solani]|uniref:Transposase family Tnp2 protein n=1 Tax=Rhizoctonia solani TaxID=456999 RepID=A0A8H2ZZW4_9AGAM|nr:unnamed protein product [Rhizoctonia solani]
MSNENLDIEPCPHCGELLSSRQIRRHLDLRRGTFYIDLDSDSDSDSDLDSDSNSDSNLPAPENPGEPNPGLVAEDVEMDNGGNSLIENFMHDLANVTLGEDGVTIAPIPRRRNPPVTIEDWPDPEDDFAHSEASNGDLPAEPSFVERGDTPLGEHPEDEALMDDEELLRFLQENLGDGVDREWLRTMYNIEPSKDEHNLLQFLASRLRTHFSRQTYDDLRYGACADLNLPSEFIAWRRLRLLSGLEMRSYDMCINSCCCFLGKYAEAQSCKFCNAPRFNSAGKARRTFQYTPLIPQLRALFLNCDMLIKLRYRLLAEGQYRPGIIQDIFDAEHYRRLRQTILDEATGYRFFGNDNDLPLGLSTDGLSLFKQARHGQSTAWPIIIINYGLHPSIRTRLENVICVGVIPGPQQCKDLNSFLVPLVEELLELEKGVITLKVSPSNPVDAPAPQANAPALRDDTPPPSEGGSATPDEPHASHILLRAFLIIIFGDIPAISKMLMIKGHNAVSPCRFCYIQGVLCRLAKSSVYYVPLARPGDPPVFVSPNQLVPRTHELFLAHYDALEAAPTQAERNRLAKGFGINSRAIFSRLKSIDLATCAPYDAMHLLFENLVPNMIRHWTSNFKGLGQGTGDFELAEDDWIEIGELTANASKTIPSTFVGTIPDIAQEENLYKAEAYSFWFQYLAPILLEGRLSEPYYE